MSAAAALLTRLRRLDIRVWTDAGKLRYSAPQGAMTDAIRAEVAKHRQELVAFLDAARNANDELPPLARAPRDVPLPLSYAQERLWFLEQLMPGGGAYNVSKAIRFSGPLRAAALRGAFRLLVERHETLRTRFPSEDGRPRQVVESAFPVDLPVADLAALDPARREAEARRLASEHARRDFDLRNGPLWHALLIRLGDDEHVLSTVLHHIVFDGASFGVLVAEIAGTYRALIARRAPVLPELPVQYADFAVWQRGWLQGDVLARQLGFWRNRLNGAPAVLELPADRRRTALRSSGGSTDTFEVDAACTEALRRLSRDNGATLYMTLMAAFAVLLYRCCGEPDVVVGTPIANRRSPELERLIGFFVNMLPIRTDLTGNPRFVDALDRVRHALVDAYSHQDLPFEMLVKELGTARDMSHAPVFQVAFQLQSGRAGSVELPGLALRPIETEDRTSKLDLAVSITEGTRALHGTIQASSDLFERATIARFGRLYVHLLGAVARDPDTRIDRLPLLDADVRDRVIARSSSAGSPVPKILHARFERLADRCPDLAAVTDGDFQLTYGELNRQARALARQLLDRGVRREQLVGICLPRSAGTVIAMLGVLKAGAAYVPMDAGLPPARLATIVDDAGLEVAIVDAVTRPQLPAGRLECIALESGDAVPDPEAAGLALPKIEPQSLAYAIYTSGSTGRPKGALLHHEGAANFVSRCIQRKLVGPHCRFLQFASIGFDASIAEVFITLNAGACLLIVPEEARRSKHLLEEWVREQAGTDAILPPTLVALLDPREFRTMHMLTVGGEVCEADTAKRWASKLRFFNAYGPTETSVGPLLCRIRSVADGERVPIGRPLADLAAYIVDGNLDVVPPGIVGEICIGGVGVGRGYLNRPDLTAERFIPDPFGRTGGGRLYRTGDLGRYRNDGNVEFVGRVDDQVKLRGFRIEPGEIESALTSLPGVREAAVVLRADGSGAASLVAYAAMQRTGAATFDADALRAALRARLPDYMVPARFVAVDALPRTPSGKIDRRALPAPRPAPPQGRHVPPRTAEEHVLARIWARVLDLPAVGVHDDFFALGGDSMKSIEVIAKARAEGLAFSPTDLFRNPTVASLAGVATRIDSEAHRIGPQSPLGNVPLTPIQHWFFEQAFDSPSHWNWAFLRRVEEPLDPERTERALHALLDHHDALRLRFERDGSGWRQFYAPPEPHTPFAVVDLSALPATRRRAALENAAEDLERSLDLRHGPLWRVASFTLEPAPTRRQTDSPAKAVAADDAPTAEPGGGASRLLILLHHLVVDVISARVLMEDFQTAYRQLEAGRAVALPPRSAAYRDWSLALTKHANELPLRAELQHWVDAVRAETARLPRDGDGANTEASADLVVRALDAEASSLLLHDVAADARVGMRAVLLTALTDTIGAWTGERALRVDLEGHGREELAGDVDVTRTVGWFTCMYPVLIDLRGGQSGRAALDHVARQLRRVPGGGIGYGLLRYLCSDARVRELLAEAPAAELNFNYLGQLDQSLAGAIPFRAATESKGHERSPTGTRTYPLYVVVSARGGVLRVHWNYSRNLHARATIERLADDYLDRLRGIAAECGKAAAHA